MEMSSTRQRAVMLALVMQVCKKEKLDKCRHAGTGHTVMQV